MDTYALDLLSEAVRLPGRAPSSCAYSPNGETFVCCAEGALSIHRVTEGVRSDLVPMENACNNCAIAMHGADKLLHSTSLNGEECLRHLDLFSGKYTRLYTGHSSPVHCLSVCSLSGCSISCADNEIRMWDHRQKSPVGIIPAKGHALAQYTPTDGTVFSVLFSEKREMKLFDSRQYSTGPYATNVLSIEKPWLSFSFSWDGFKAAISTENEVHIINGITGQSISSLKTESTSPVCFSAGDEYVIYLPEDKCISFSAQSLKKQSFSLNASESVHSLAFNPVYAQMAVLSSSYASFWHCPAVTESVSSSVPEII